MKSYFGYGAIVDLTFGDLYDHICVQNIVFLQLQYINFNQNYLNGIPNASSCFKKYTGA